MPKNGKQYQSELREIVVCWVNGKNSAGSQNQSIIDGLTAIRRSR